MKSNTLKISLRVLVVLGCLSGLIAGITTVHADFTQGNQTASLSANPARVSRGASTALTWSSNAVRCFGEGFQTNGAPSGTVSVGPLTQNQNYQLACSDNGSGSAIRNITVIVTPPQPAAQCSPSQSEVTVGDSLTWSSTVSGGTSPYTYSWSSGTSNESLSGTGSTVQKSYSSAGTKQAIVKVTDSSTTVSPSTRAGIYSPAGYEEVMNESSTCDISGATAVGPKGGYYGSNYYGDQVSEYSPVEEGYGRLDPPADFYSNPENYCFNANAKDKGALEVPTSNMYWQWYYLPGGTPGSFRNHPTQGSADKVSSYGEKSGTVSFKKVPVTTTSTPQQTTAMCQVEVKDRQVQPKPDVVLYAQPTDIDEGNRSVLTWVSHNADSCSSNDIDTQGGKPNASSAVTPTATKTYQITCTGAGGTSDPAEVTVIVHNLLPDLTATVSGPATVKVGEEATIQGIIKNGGRKNASASTAVFVTRLNARGDDWDTKQPALVPALQAGSSRDVSTTLSWYSPGTYWYGVCADNPWNPKITESDESNNCDNKQITVLPNEQPGGVDLQPVDGAAITVTVGEPVTLTAGVSNVGDNATGKGFNNTIWIDKDVDGRTFASKVVGTGSMNAHEQNRTLTTSYTFPEVGVFFYKVCVDTDSSDNPWYKGTIDESNEFNNCGNAVQVNVQSGPTLNSPTNVHFSCNADGTAATMTWDPTPNATSYDPRADDPTNNNASCSDGWYCSDPPDKYQDNITGTSFTYSTVVPNRWYNFWVHAVNSREVTSPTNIGFMCPGPETPGNRTVSCAANPQTAAPGESITWRASANGFSNPSFTWTDSFTGGSGSGSTYQNSYSNPGSYTVHLKAEQGGRSAEADCSPAVIANACTARNAPSISANDKHPSVRVPLNVDGVANVRIAWNATGAGMCTISGPGLSADASCTVPNDARTVQISTRSIYTITCDGGTDKVIVDVTPYLKEF